MSSLVAHSEPDGLDEPALTVALADIAAGAAERERPVVPPFPEDAVVRLERAGALAWGATAGALRPPAAAELALVRRVAAADGSVGRIFDGHVNAVERLAVQGPADLRARELPLFASARLRAGVWGADPVPGEGEPAAVREEAGGLVLDGVKTFCSGAGGLHRALVLARDARAAGPSPPLAVWIDVGDRDRVEVDESWFAGHGLRASVSHRVVFRSAPVLGVFGGPGALAEDPWFSRDALRTAASWAGMADSAARSALAELRARPAPTALEHLAAGRVGTLHRTIDLWVAEAARAMDEAGPDLRATSIHARDAIASACRRLLDEAAAACGSRPFATATALDRARRDLELFLLQHRLDPLLARAGEQELGS